MAHASARSFEISTPLPVSLAGWASLPKAHRVNTPLEFNMLELGAGSERIVLVTVDLLYPGPGLRKAAERVIEGRLPKGNLLLAASHTHHAPASDQTKPALGEIRPEFLATITENMRLHLSAMLDQPSVPVALRATSFEADHSVNRRLRRLRVMQDGVLSYGVSAGFNPRGSRDEMVTALIVGDPDEPKAIVWNYACHPTAFPDHSSVSPDFPGVVRAALREHFTNPVLPVLFLQGFSGDTRPPSRWRPRGWKDLVKRMLWGPVFSDFDDAKYRTWSESLAEVVVAGIARDSTLLHPELQIERLELPRSDFVIEATPQSIPMVFQAIRVGDLMIAGASAEVVSGYSSIVRGASQFAMPTGCLDTPIGYIPTASQLREGGYESGDFCRAFGLGGVSDKIAVHAAEGLTAVVIAASRREPPSASGQA